MIDYDKHYYICDICGQPADGDFSSSSYLNGEVYREYSWD